MGFWPVVLNVLKNSDVVLLVLDARMPEITRNQEIISKVEVMRGKRLFFVFNKCDLISKKELEKLKTEYKDSFFVSGKNKEGINSLRDYLVNLSENWSGRKSLRVGFVGYPNVGKSSLINLIAPEAQAKVSSVSGTTRKTQWVRIGRIRIMDSPGVIPYGDKNIQVGMVAAKDPHKIKDPEKVAINVIEYLRKKGNILERFYGVSSQESDYDLFLEIGKKKGFLLKGGEIDEHRTAITVIEDWQKGKISLK